MELRKLRNALIREFGCTLQSNQEDSTRESDMKIATEFVSRSLTQALTGGGLV